jgi:hypothetical protein
MLLSIKKAGKVILRSLRHVLPERVYVRTYDYLFLIYKYIAWKLYSLKRYWCAFRGDRHGERMVADIARIMPYTLVGVGGLEATYKLSERVIDQSLPGSFVELGVARGGCAAMMAGVAFREQGSNRVVWLFDSFEGLPDPTEADFVPGKGDLTGEHVRPLTKGACLGTEEEVQHLFFEEFGFSKERVRFVKGWFLETLPSHRKEIGEIAVLRIDGDWYESTKCCLDYLYDQVITGGSVIIDDYESCHGCRKAVDEFLVANALNGILLEYDGRGGAYFLKP